MGYGILFQNKYSALYTLKSHILSLPSETRRAYFFSHGANGDRANFYSYLTLFRNLTGLQPIVLSIDQPDPLVGLFPGIRNNSLAIPRSLLAGCSLEQLPWVLGDPVPGEGRIYFTGCAYYLDGHVSDSWLRKNEGLYNAFSLTKMILGLPSQACPEQLCVASVMDNVSDGFRIPDGPYLLFAPHSFSCPELLPQDFWSAIVLGFTGRGVRCFVNLPALQEGINTESLYDAGSFRAVGAEVFQGGFNDLVALGLGAQHVVTTRSGFADLLNLTSQSSYSVVYPPCFSHITEYFGLKNSFGHQPAEELLVSERIDLGSLATSFTARLLELISL